MIPISATLKEFHRYADIWRIWRYRGVKGVDSGGMNPERWPDPQDESVPCAGHDYWREMCPACFSSDLHAKLEWVRVVQGLEYGPKHPVRGALSSPGPDDGALSVTMPPREIEELASASAHRAVKIGVGFFAIGLLIGGVLSAILKHL